MLFGGGGEQVGGGWVSEGGVGGLLLDIAAGIGDELHAGQMVAVEVGHRLGRIGDAEVGVGLQDDGFIYPANIGSHLGDYGKCIPYRLESGLFQTFDLNTLQFDSSEASRIVGMYPDSRIIGVSKEQTVYGKTICNVEMPLPDPSPSWARRPSSNSTDVTDCPGARIENREVKLVISTGPCGR